MNSMDASWQAPGRIGAAGLCEPHFVLRGPVIMRLNPSEAR